MLPSLSALHTKKTKQSVFRKWNLFSEEEILLKRLRDRILRDETLHVLWAPPCYYMK